MQRGASQEQTSASSPGPSSSTEIPGAAELCARPGVHATERNSSNWCFPVAGSQDVDYQHQEKDQLVRGSFLCTAKELSAAEVSCIPGRMANLADNEGSSSPPLLGITPSFSINP